MTSQRSPWPLGRVILLFFKNEIYISTVKETVEMVFLKRNWHHNGQGDRWDVNCLYKPTSCHHTSTDFPFTSPRSLFTPTQFLYHGPPSNRSHHLRIAPIHHHCYIALQCLGLMMKVKTEVTGVLLVKAKVF